jgi:hypothetical protein
VSGTFDASTPPPEGPGVREAIARARAEQAAADLERALGRIEEVVARFDESEAEAGLDPEIEALLEEVAGSPDAPLEFQSLHRRVHAGRLTWADFWARPQAESGGARLLGAVMRLHLEQVAQLPREEPQP